MARDRNRKEVENAKGEEEENRKVEKRKTAKRYIKVGKDESPGSL